MPKQTLSYRFVLSDEEFGSMWLREYYRRPGWRAWRVIGGPCFIALGIAMARGSDLFTTGMGIVSIVFGLWYSVRPFIAMKAMVGQRRRDGRSGIEIELRLHRDGVRISDGKAIKEIPWENIVRSGESERYFWYELKGGSRATIPVRVVEDRDALREKLAAHSEWVA